MIQLFQRDIGRLLGGTAFIFACRVFGAALVLLSQVLLARWMGADELGIYVFAFSWGMVLSIVTGLGYPTATFRVIHQYLTGNQTSYIRGFILRGKQIIFVCGTVIAGLIALLFIYTDNLVEPSTKNTLLLALFIIPLFGLIRLNDGIAHTYSWLILRFLPTPVLRPLLFLLLVLALWLSGETISAEITMACQVTAMFVIGFIQYLFLTRYLNKTLPPVSPSFETSAWTRLSVPMLIIVLFTQYFPELNIIIAGVYMPNDEVAIYNAAFRIAMVINFFIMAVDGYVRPKAARYFAEGKTEALQQIVARGTQLMFWPGLLVTVLFALFGGHILELFGSEFVAGHHALIVLSLGQLFLAAMGPVASLLSITGHQDHCLYVFGGALLFTILSNIVLVPILGLLGAAIAVLIANVFSTLWLHSLVKRYIKIRPSVFALSLALNR